MKKLTLNEIHSMFDEYQTYLSDHFTDLSFEMIKFYATSISNAITAASKADQQSLLGRWLYVHNFYWCNRVYNALKHVPKPIAR